MFLPQVLGQVKTWLSQMTVQKLVIVIKAIDTNEVLERWQFDVKCDKNNMTDDGYVVCTSLSSISKKFLYSKLLPSYIIFFG